MALKVTQTRSAIGTKPKQRGTLRALGLGRIGRSNVLPDRPEIHGMIHRVPHLVTVENVSESGEATSRPVTEKPADPPAEKSTAAKTTTKKAAKKTDAEKSTAAKTTTKKAAKKSTKKTTAKTTTKKAAKKSQSGSATSGGGENKAST
jgi:large subunit ribosomal protein L30